ncbi:TRAP transporter large permease [Siminovitchia sediminis]|uniref:TRAP transporter large permease n=1 Tax=Siminovitchia sediminis TaxID=1274353 RepID=A0ABW4KJ32_9BACI
MDFLMFGAFIVSLLLLLIAGVPVAVSLGIVGIVGGALLISPAMIDQLSQIAFTQSSSFVLIVAPLFVLMSEIISSSSIGTRLFTVVQMWLGRLPGALGMAAVISCSGFAAICGSSPVTAATIGKVAIPEMSKIGYSERLALGATAAGGTLGILIPPSIALILYGVITETSIGDLFIAGIIPGIMTAILLCFTIFVIVLKNPSLAPAVQEKVRMKERVTGLIHVTPILILAFLVIGSIYIGMTTPTESAAFGVVGALVIVFTMRQLGLKNLSTVLSNTVKTTGMFFLLVIGGMFTSFVLTRLRIPQGMAEFILGLEVPGWAIIVIINVLILILGMFLDPMSILVIVVPIFFPTVVGLGFDPIWFGILVTINMEIGAITPPVGFNLFVLKSVIPNVKMSDVVVGSLWFVVPLLASLIIIGIFPKIALYLPSLMS